MKRFVWVILFLFLFLAALGHYLIGEYRLRDNFNKTREKLMLIASNAALSIDAAALLKVPLVQSAEATSPEYEVIYQKLVKIKKANPLVKYAYTMVATEQPGILQYVVDANPAPEIITARCPTSLPGDKYDAREIPEMMNAYYKPSADKTITTDVWGIFISGYAPIRDSTGKAVAILGVDTDATLMQITQKRVKERLDKVSITGILFLLSFATLIRFHIGRKKS
jgi:hypothetical protein